jgi:hypothetical protein
MCVTSEPVLLEVLARVPTDLLHCSHCEQLFSVAGIGRKVHEEIRTSYPPEFLEEAELLAAWLRALSTRYGEDIQIRVVDVQSLEGFFKSLRHRVFQYPAFVVDHQATYTGWARGDLRQLLDACVVEKVMKREE